MDKKLTKFSLSLYGNVTAYDDTKSLARCRIFYKYGNRNGTYITDEFAEQLISTLPYAPVKGIYDSMEEDFTDHGRQRYEGRIYGVVPVNNHFAWEKHLDEDGVEREYACTDVLLYTGIYKDEAVDIVNCSQSMELYADSIDGEWKFIEGKKYFVFNKGSFLGLQALGKDYEPCFEGAAFYSLYESIQELVSRIEQFELQSTQNVGGENQMNFKLSDNQKYDMIWTLLNSRFNEENGYVMDYAVCDVYDEYAIIFGFENRTYERAYYSKDDASDSLEIVKREACYIVDVNDEEKRALEVLHAMNGNTYEKIDEKFANLEEANNSLNEEKQNFSQKIEEQNQAIATLQQEKADTEVELNTVKENYTESLTTIETLTNEKDALAEQVQGLETYKASIIRSEKEAMIERYAEMLDEEAINSFKEKIDDMSKEELDKELAYTYVQSQPTLFNHQNEEPGFVPKDNEPKSGIEGILDRYKK